MKTKGIVGGILFMILTIVGSLFIHGVFGKDIDISDKDMKELSVPDLSEDTIMKYVSQMNEEDLDGGYEIYLDKRGDRYSVVADFNPFFPSYSMEEYFCGNDDMCAEFILIVVHPGGNLSLQAAINYMHNNTAFGGVVYVMPGIYYCDNLTLFGTSENQVMLYTERLGDVVIKPMVGGDKVIKYNRNSHDSLRNIIVLGMGNTQCVFAQSSNPTFINCIFGSGYHNVGGGAIFGEDCNLIIDSCSFLSNNSITGSAIKITGLANSTSIAKSKFIANGWLEDTNGTVFIDGTDSILFTRCSFQKNTGWPATAINWEQLMHTDPVPWCNILVNCKFGWNQYNWGE